MKPLFATAKSASFLCRKHITYIEKNMGIPAGLLAAISIIESGKKAEGHKELIAWPWVINVEGKPEYYKTKTDAVKALTKHLDQGIVNIDVGCMQINFRHHGAEFRSPSYMMDPRRNVTYAAQFLGALRKQYGSWTKAVGHYHSATLKHQVPYRHKVYRKWQQVRQHEKKQHSQKKEQVTLADMGKEMALKLGAQVQRFTGAFDQGVQKEKQGYEVIKPQKPVVKLRALETRKGIGELVPPYQQGIRLGDQALNKPPLSAQKSKRKPHFFKGEK